MAAEVTAKLKLDAAQFRASVDRAAQGWGGFSKQLRSEAREAARVLAPVAKGVAAIGVAATAAAGVGVGVFGWMIKDGLKLNSQMEQARATFTAFTKDAELSKQIVEELKKEADITPFDTTEMVTAGKALISSAKGSRDELMKLVKTAEVLAALNPAQGLEGAAFALREAMGGDFVSLQSRFDVSRNLIKEIRSQGKEGLDVVNAALAQMGAGPELVEGLAQSFDGLMGTSMSFFDQVKQTMAEPLFDTLKGELQDFIELLDGGAKEGVLDFAKALGGSFDEGLKDLFGMLKSMDWKAMAEGAKSFAEGLGSAAANTGNVVKAASKTGGQIMNVADKLALGVQTAISPFTWGGFREEIEASNQNFINRIQAREAGWAQEQAHASEVSQTKAPIKSSDVVENWLRSRGKSRADLAKDPELAMEAQQMLGPLLTAADTGRDFAQAYVPTARPTAKVPVQVTLNQVNPMHQVMAT